MHRESYQKQSISLGMRFKRYLYMKGNTHSNLSDLMLKLKQVMFSSFCHRTKKSRHQVEGKDRINSHAPFFIEGNTQIKPKMYCFYKSLSIYMLMIKKRKKGKILTFFIFPKHLEVISVT